MITGFVEPDSKPAGLEEPVDLAATGISFLGVEIQFLCTSGYYVQVRPQDSCCWEGLLEFYEL